MHEERLWEPVGKKRLLTLSCLALMMTQQDTKSLFIGKCLRHHCAILFQIYFQNYIPLASKICLNTLKLYLICFILIFLLR